MGILSTLAALVAITTAKISAAEGATGQAERHLRTAGHGRHKHHVRFSHLTHHGASTPHNAKHDAGTFYHAKAQMSPDEKFGVIQKKLIGAWKEKAHLEHLQSTLKSQKALLDAQEKVLLANNDVDDEERKQILQMYQMVKESRALADKVRKSAVKKTRDAMAAVMNIDSSKDRLIEHNKQEILDLQLKIAQDIAANSEANRTKQRAKTVLAAAVQEAKYFQAILDKAKMEKQDARNEEQSMVDIANKLKESQAHEEQEDEAGVRKDDLDDKQQAAEERDKDREGDNQDKQPRDDKVAREDREVLATLKHIITEAD